jgi:hypothetical protein
MSHSNGTHFSVRHFETGSWSDLESDGTSLDYDIKVIDDEPKQLGIKAELEIVETATTNPSLHTSTQITSLSLDSIQATSAGSTPRTAFVLLAATVDTITRLVLLIGRIWWVTAWTVVGAAYAPFVTVLGYFVWVDWAAVDTLTATWILFLDHIRGVVRFLGSLAILAILLGILRIVSWINWAIKLLPQRWQVSQITGPDGAHGDNGNTPSRKPRSARDQ